MLRNVCLMVLACSVAFTACPAQAAPPALAGWDVSWFDDFDGSQVNTGLWDVIFSTNPTNNSLQAYLPSQVSQTNGNLIITATDESFGSLPYRSGQVISKIDQQYGKWEVRANLPTTKGQWPAIWLLPDAGIYPWPSQGEIDIMENRGDQPQMTSSAFHYGTNPPYSHSFVYGEQSGYTNGQPKNFHNQFHTYGVEWTDDQLRFFVDGVNYYNVYDDQVGGFLGNQSVGMETVINNAIGGDFLDDPDGSTVWPQNMLIDYVHVYEEAAVPAPLVLENGSFDGGQSPLAGWTTFGVTDFGNVQPHFQAVRSGTHSTKLYGQFNGALNYSGIEQGITVTGGEEVRALIHEYIRSDDSISGTNNQLVVKIDYYNQKHGRFGSSAYISTDSIVVADGSTQNNAWLERELRSTAPAGAVEARLAISFVQPSNASGAVHVDDVVFGLRGENVMTWQGNGDGLWTSNQWGGVGPAYPSDFDSAVIRTNRVSVVGSKAAYATTVESGILNLSGQLTSDVTVQSGGALANRGTLAGDLGLEGQIAVEHVGAVTVSGVVTIDDAALRIEPSYSQTPGTYTGDFVLIEAGQLIGAIADESGDHLGDGLFLHQVTSNSTQVTVDLYAALPGDANGDGTVDGADFVVWNVFKFQSDTDWTSGDFNEDGTTNGADFIIWNENKFTSADQIAVVPEPTGWLLVMLGAAWFPSRKMSRQRRRSP